MIWLSPRVRAGALALVVPLVLAGCSTEPEPEEAAPSSAPVPVTAQDAVAQLDRYLVERDRALTNRQVDHVSLRAVATDEMLLWVQEQVVGMLQNDVVQTGDYVHTLGDPAADDEGLVIVDCEDRTDVTFTADGEVRDPDYVNPEGDPLRNPVQVEYRMVEDDADGQGVWKVSATQVLWDQSC